MFDIDTHKARALYRSGFEVGGDPGSVFEVPIYSMCASFGLSERQTRACGFRMMQVVVPVILGIQYEIFEPVAYLDAAALLYMVNRDIYGQPDDDVRTYAQADLRLACDEVWVYRNGSGVPVLYHHFAHGDCDSSWFVVEPA